MSYGDEQEERFAELMSDLSTNYLRRSGVGMTPLRESAPTPQPGLNKEFQAMQKNTYSLARALQCALNSERPGFKKASGFELEIHQELSRQMPTPPQGFLIPLNAIKAQTAGSAPSGGFTVGESIVTVADALRPASIAINSGAMMVDLAPGAKVPRISTGTTAHWLAETEECPEGTAALSAVSLSPKRCAAWLKVTNQLLSQAPLAEAVLMRDLRQAVGAALDLGLFSGIGGVEPLGLLNNPDVQTVTFGNAADRAELAAMERKLGDENANDTNAIWVTTPTVRQKWRNKTSDTTGIGFLWGDDNRVLGRPARASNNITDNRAILGDFSDLLIVNWGVMEIRDPYTAKKSAQTELLVQIMADGAPMRGKSFVTTTDSAAQ